MFLRWLQRCRAVRRRRVLLDASLVRDTPRANARCSFREDKNKPLFRRSADENLPVVEFARTPMSSRPRRDSGESHYDPGNNSTAARLEFEEFFQRLAHDACIWISASPDLECDRALVNEHAKTIQRGATPFDGVAQ